MLHILQEVNELDKDSKVENNRVICKCGKDLGESTEEFIKRMKKMIKNKVNIIVIKFRKGIKERE